jgi:hypothetical protein
VIRANLSTRPFYNDRVIHLTLAAIALVVVVATAFNISRVIRYSRSGTQLAMQAASDQARAADLHAGAVRLRASVDPRQIDLASGAARQANDLIDRRTFSWTELLNRFETTLPPDAKITAVRPRLDRKEGTVVQITVTAKTVEDVDKFMENLRTAGAFYNLRPIEERPTEQGLWEAALEAGYVPGGQAATGGAPPR